MNFFTFITISFLITLVVIAVHLRPFDWAWLPLRQKIGHFAIFTPPIALFVWATYMSWGI